MVARSCWHGLSHGDSAGARSTEAGVGVRFCHDDPAPTVGLTELSRVCSAAATTAGTPVAMRNKAVRNLLRYSLWVERIGAEGARGIENWWAKCSCWTAVTRSLPTS